MELASLQDKLKEEGWNLSTSGIEIISENGKITDVKSLIKKAIDIDLKSISQGTLPEDINKTKYEQIPGNIVLQIQKIKNLSSPKSSDSNCTSSSILKLNLTDGVQNVQAIPMDPIQNIHMNTYPGSKIHIKSENIDVSHCFLLLFNSTTQFLGGRVDSLVEKWELNKRLAKHTRDRGVDEGGPPPWIGFGQKIVKQSVSDKNFKSLDLAKNKDSLENSEFEAQRKGAILEATKIGCTKVFGGGNNKLLDYNVQQIVDAGFTIEDAEYALKISKNNLDKALRNLQNKYNKGNKDENSKSSKTSGSEENKKGGKGRNRHRDEDSGPTLKPSGKVSLFDFLEDKLPFSEPPVEAKPPPQEKRNGIAFKANNKANFKPNAERSKPGNEDKRMAEKPESKNSKKNIETSKTITKFEFSDKRNFSDKKSEFGKFESKKNFDRTDKSLGNYKNKHDLKNGEYNSRNEFFKNKANEKRGQTNGNISAIKSHGRSMDLTESKKAAGFAQPNEKPPRFQKFQNQQNDTQGVQNWSDHANYNRIPQNDFQLQNSIANLTLHQSIANFQNQNSQDGYGDVLSGVSGANTKPNNLFYQSVVTQSSENRIMGNQSGQPPSAPHQSHLNYANRNVGGFIHQEVKNSTFPSIPNLQDVAFKNNAPLLHGYSDFQSVFGNARAPSSSYPNPPYMTNPNGMPPQSHKPWIWNKGDKCMARYWEDQMYYNAVVTAVSENTCVVRFTDYGNYEEVLQDHCIPITEVHGASSHRSRLCTCVSDKVSLQCNCPQIWFSKLSDI